MCKRKRENMENGVSGDIVGLWCEGEESGGVVNG